MTCKHVCGWLCGLLVAAIASAQEWAQPNGLGGYDFYQGQAWMARTLPQPGRQVAVYELQGGIPQYRGVWTITPIGPRFLAPAIPADTTSQEARRSFVGRSLLFPSRPRW